MIYRPASSSRPLTIALLCLLHPILSTHAFAHDGPVQLPDPHSIPEAWNVLEECSANVDKLLDENLLRDIGFQIANTAGPLRLLQSDSNNARPDDVRNLTDQLLAMDAQVILATREPLGAFEKTRQIWIAYQKSLSQLESCYPADTVHAAVYICPMHPHDVHLKPDDRCSVCGMTLICRHLPASSVYERPGEPSMDLKVIGSPLVIGRKAELRIRISTRDGKPVSLDDLVLMHTKKIHLLINDRSLSDYHHEHPEPTGVPGEYAFSFIPTKPGPYRVWADVVPAATSIQEYLIADIPADTAPLALSPRQTVTSVVVNGRKYDLDLGHDPIHAGQTVVGTITVAGPGGEGFTQLEPVMGAFAHIVGFSEDEKTVLHIHPFARDPSGPDDRAGPAFAFKFYAPSPGFLRLYGQVQIGGVSQFAPFALTILPAKTPATSPTPRIESIGNSSR